MPAPGAAASCGDGRDEAGRCLSPAGRLAAAVCLGAVGSLGFCSNLLVLLLFWRFRALRSPINLLLLNIALSDLLGCALGTPLGLAAGAAAAPGAACAWHGFATALCGIISLISLAVLSYERYCTMTRTTEADTTNYRKSWTGIILSWTYSLLWTVPPLFGWSSYGPEGPGITCSVNWHSKDANNASYIICLFIFCLVIPFAIIVYSYGKLLCAVRQVSSINKGLGRSREQRILVMVVVMVVCFLLCWLPYAAVALIATFGKPGLITPAASIIPAILAKSSTVYNPIIYIFLNKQFYRCFVALLKCNKPTESSTKALPRPCPALQQVQGGVGPAGTALAGQPSARQPSDGQPSDGQPLAGQPLARKPLAGQRLAGQPLAGQPSAGQPSAGQPLAGQPSAGQPSAGQPSAGQPLAGQPLAGQPSDGQPLAGQPLAESLCPAPGDTVRAAGAMPEAPCGT